MEARQARAAALLGRSQACPFDLHTLLPVPAAILQLGPSHPDGTNLAGGALGHHRPAAPGGRAAEPGHRPAAGETSYRDRLRVLHRWRDAACRHRRARRPLAGAAFLTRAAARRLSDAGMPASTADAEAPLAEGSEHAGEAAASEVPATSATAMSAPGQGAAEERTPLLSLDGFTGPLERLLTLARAHQIDLAQLSLAALIDQLVAALRHAPPATPLGEKGDWVVMAAWLVQLRSVLLLPPEAPARQDATVAADLLRARLIALQATQALAAWLRPAAATWSRRVCPRAPRTVWRCQRDRAGARRHRIPLVEPGAVR